MVDAKWLLYRKQLVCCCAQSDTLLLLLLACLLISEMRLQRAAYLSRHVT
jgi:hypothetical protein